MRKTELKNDEFYHIYNRGVDKREVFLDSFDYLRFLKSLQEFNSVNPIGSLYEKYLRSRNGSSTSTMEVELPTKKLVEIVCYCLNPNHYHLILKQVAEKGIERFMQRLGTGYTKYFNQKNKRTGTLFQGRFKSVHIDSNEYLLYLSAYVNKNKFIHGYDNEFNFSSLEEYIGKTDYKLCDKDIILKQFRNKKEYAQYLEVNAKHLKEKKELARYLIE